MTRIRDRKPDTPPDRGKIFPDIADPKREFVRIFNRLDRKKHKYDVFRDFLTCAFCAIAKTTVQTDKAKADKLEAQYMQVVKSYAPDELDVIREHFPKLMMLATDGVFERCDFLGEVYHELELHNKELGQFFTPYSLSYMMAKMTYDNVDPAIKQKRFFTVQEPAAGAGCMLLAMADALQDNKVDPAYGMWFEAVDLSEMAFKMCYIQCSLRGLSGRVSHGNTLSMEIFDSYVTPVGLMFLGLRGNPFREQDNRQDLGPPLINKADTDLVPAPDFFA